MSVDAELLSNGAPPAFPALLWNTPPEITAQKPNKVSLSVPYRLLVGNPEEACVGGLSLLCAKNGVSAIGQRRLGPGVFTEIRPYRKFSAGKIDTLG
jgi:hypothetical protein